MCTSHLRYILALLATAVLVLAIETVEDAAIIARRLLDCSKNSIGTMATVYPGNDSRLPTHPFSLQEYYASQNILGTPGHSASISVMSEVPAARHARVSLIGNVTVFNDGSSAPKVESLRRCYLKRHPDAKRWLPDDKDGAHVAYWARFDPHSIYFVGGFGGRHYIGYIPLSLYQAASGAIEEDPRTAENVLFEQ